MDEMETLRDQLRGRNLRAVADSAGVGHSWLLMFARGEIPAPAYWRVKAVQSALKQDKRRTA